MFCLVIRINTLLLIFFITLVKLSLKQMLTSTEGDSRDPRFLFGPFSSFVELRHGSVFKSRPCFVDTEYPSAHSLHDSNGLKFIRKRENNVGFKTNIRSTSSVPLFGED